MNNSTEFSDSSILSMKVMEELSADYAFGKLEGEQKISFESSLPHFPEIEAEIIQVRSVFDNFDREDFLSKKAKQSRNISVRVLERRTLEELRSRKFRKFFRQLSPAFALCTAFLIFVGYQKYAIHKSDLVGFSKTENIYIQKQDIQMLIGAETDTNEKSISEIAKEMPNFTVNEPSKNTNLTDTYSNASNQQNQAEYVSGDFSKDALFSFADYFNGDLDENDLQSIFEEFNNNEVL